MDAIKFCLSIIVPTVGRPEILSRTLVALNEAIRNLDVEVIVVDDSKDGRVDVGGFPFILMRTGGKGASHARNLGLAEAKAPLILFLDDDILIQEGHLQKTLELHANTGPHAYNFFWEYPPDLMALLPKSKFGRYILKKGLYSNKHRLAYALDDKPDIIEENGLTSQYFSIEKRWMLEAGGYDDIPNAGVEDMMLFKKLKALGVRCYLCQKELVYQNEFNRLSAESVMKRYRSGAQTRRIAYERGHQDLGVSFSGLERVKGVGLLLLENPLKFLERVLPFGWLYCKTVNVLLFAATFRGFYKDTLPSDFSD